MTQEARREALGRVLEEYPGADTSDVDADLEQYLLVEKNVSYGDPPYYTSTHDTPGDAAAYHVDQEYAEDWEPEVLIDLDDTTRRFDPITTIGWEPQ